MDTTAPREKADPVRQERDIAIVHLTDLHFGSPWVRPLWVADMTAALARLASNNDISIFGLAVTGDLVNGPESNALLLVRDAIKEWARNLGLTAPNDDATEPGAREPDWSRIWIVDGNHDYRKWGLFRLKKTDGIAEGQLLARADCFHGDPEKRFLILGLNSSKRGPVARGRVELSDLRNFQRRVEANRTTGFRYRIALIHHHLLPLPERASEFDAGTERLKRIIYDESSKLLANAGLTTEILLGGDIDLVLHGHEHKEFSASVSYHDPRKGSRVMAVVGGPNCATGFQVVYFRRTGDVDLVRYKFGNGGFEEHAEIRLWSYDEWKRAEWDRLRRVSGYYERAISSAELFEIGDLRQSTEVTNIFGGTNAIPHLAWSREAGDKVFGRVQLENVHDKETGRDIPRSKLPPVGPEYSFKYELMPPATSSQRNRGFIAVGFSRNNMSITQEDAALVNKKPPEDGAPFTELLRFSYQYPVRRLTYFLRFPPEFAPEQVRVVARMDRNGSQVEDTAETLRAASKLIYRRSDSLVVLDLDWVTQHHEYHLSWELPSQSLLYRDLDRANTNRQAIALMESRLGADKELANDTKSVLSDIRKRCFDRIVELGKVSRSTASIVTIGNDDIGIWVLDCDRNVVRPIAGTYADTSPFWNAELQYGAGIRGATMRRGINEFYPPRAVRKSDFYHQLNGCPREEQLFCVPVPLAEQIDSSTNRSRKPSPLGRCWMVACIGSLTQGGIWHHLIDERIRDDVAALLMFEVLDVVKEIVPELR
jgi:3',5'-cyclic AMP phosphodiesterase CpdA